MLQRLKNKIFQPKILALIALDFILLPLALFTAVWLRLGGEWDCKINAGWWIFLVMPLWTIPIFVKLGLYRAVIRYLDEKIIEIVLLGVSISVAILVLLIYMNRVVAFPRTSLVIFWVFALAYIGGSRLLLRGLLRKSKLATRHCVVIYGAGRSGVQLALALQNGNEYEPVAFCDDDIKKWYTTIRGVKVYPPNEIIHLAKEHQLKQILLAIPSVSVSRRKEIIQKLEPLALQIKTIPGMAELISGKVKVDEIKELEIDELLGRDTVPAKPELLKKNITGQIVMVTGAGGSIGSELVRQIARLNPKQLILFELGEFALYNIEQELNISYPNLSKIAVLGSVCDEAIVDNILRKYNINTIYHAAAYKHVPLVEYNPLAGIYNNAVGTWVVANAAIKHKVANMVLISTDKAVRPSNIMGASKRLAEQVLQSLDILQKQIFLENASTAKNNKPNITILTMVRFGNVLGSSGSVVPLFKQQIKSGGPITVTDPKIIRYFMTIPEAVQLVIQAGNMAHGGEVFVLDMGEPVKIYNLAMQMIHLSGLSVKDANNPNGDIAIKFTGLRPGEKLYEELLIGNNPESTEHPRIMRANESTLDNVKISEIISGIKIAMANYNNDQAVSLLKQAVPEYCVTN